MAKQKQSLPVDPFNVQGITIWGRRKLRRVGVTKIEHLKGKTAEELLAAGLTDTNMIGLDMLMKAHRIKYRS